MKVTLTLTEQQIKEILRQYLAEELGEPKSIALIEKPTIKVLFSKKFAKRRPSSLKGKQRNPKWVGLDRDILDVIPNNSRLTSHDIYDKLKLSSDKYKIIPFGTISYYINSLLSKKKLIVTKKIGKTYLYEKPVTPQDYNMGR